MVNIDKYNGEQLKATLYFDNNQTIILNSTNTEDLIIQTGKIKESMAITSGNPLGIMTSNTVSLTVKDATGNLVPTNSASPYYGYMRNGVKIVLEIINADNTTAPFGTYYTDSWSVNRKDGSYDYVNITGQDKLTYIGNMEIPALPAYSGIDIKSVLNSIFLGIGLTADDFHIDSSLTLTLAYSVAKGDKLRDTLNSIAQALIARIYIDRDAVIQVVPAFPTLEVWGNMSDEGIISALISHNTNNQYNKVRLDYVSLGVSDSETLATISNYNVVKGNNSINSVSIPRNTQQIDGLDFEYTVTPTDTDYSNIITDIDYIGYQGGVSITFNSNRDADFMTSINIIGRTASSTNASVYSVVYGTDVKVANTLMLSSDYIQDPIYAQQYVNNVASYLGKMSQKYEVSSICGPSIMSGKYISVTSGLSTISGTDYVSDITFNFSTAYSVQIGFIKMSS